MMSSAKRASRYDGQEGADDGDGDIGSADDDAWKLEPSARRRIWSNLPSAAAAAGEEDVATLWDSWRLVVAEVKIGRGAGMCVAINIW